MLEFTGDVAKGEVSNRDYDTAPKQMGGTSGGNIDFPAGIESEVDKSVGNAEQHQNTFDYNKSGEGFESVEKEPKY